MTELAGLIAVVAFTAAGAGLAELVPALRGLPLPRRLAYSYLLGVAWVAGALYAGSHLVTLPLSAGSALARAAVPGTAGVAARHRRRAGAREGAASAKRLAPGARASWLLAAAALAGCVSIAVLATAATGPLSDWDGRMTWAAQARYVRAAGTVLPAVLTRPHWFVSHPRYPLLLPVAQVAAQELARAEGDEQPFRLSYGVFYPVLLLLLYDGAVRRAGRRAAALAVLATAPIPLLAFVGEGGATSAYSDLPLACFYGAALLLLLRPRLRAADGAAAGLLLAAVVLTKNEGAILAPAALILAGWPRARRPRVGARRPRSPLGGVRRRLQPLAAAGAGLLGGILLLESWRSAIPNRHDEAYSELLSLERLVAGLGNAPEVLSLLVRRSFASEEWLLFWWVALAALAAAGTKTLRHARILAAAAVPLIIGWSAYAVHSDPLYLAGVTWNRLLLQGLIPSGVIVATALRATLAEAFPRGSRPGIPALERAGGRASELGLSPRRRP